MLGVDKLDQLIAYSSFLHKSVKWWRKIFLLLEVMVINAYIIYKELARREEIHHLAFQWRLIESLSATLQQCLTGSRSGPRTSHHLERLHPVRYFPQKGRKWCNCMVSIL